eukprot:1078827-Pyramimonas_sp.AAC.1
MGAREVVNVDGRRRPHINNGARRGPQNNRGGTVPEESKDKLSPIAGETGVRKGKGKGNTSR